MKAETSEIHILVPDELVGKTIEVLAFEIDDTSYRNIEEADVKSAIHSVYKNLRADFTGFVFDRDEANSR